MDFVHDQLATGQKLRVLTVVDAFSRYSPALEPRFTFRDTDVVAVLETVSRKVGLPTTIRVDQGTEFVSRAAAAVAGDAMLHPRVPNRQFAAAALAADQAGQQRIAMLGRPMMTAGS
jgi:transposase InsO family protein